MLTFYLSLLDTEEERQSFTELYNSHRKTMFYIANEILGDRYLAEEVVHDCFLVIIENFQKFSQIRCHKTLGLIDVIVKRRAINILNRNKQIEQVLYDENTIDGNSTQQADTAEIVASNDTITRIIDAIQGMDEKYRAVLLLKYEYECSSKEAAAMLELPEATVRQHLHRGRTKLRELLAEEL